MYSGCDFYLDRGHCANFGGEATWCVTSNEILGKANDGESATD
jgi:hypothetical protein